MVRTKINEEITRRYDSKILLNKKGFSILSNYPSLIPGVLLVPEGIKSRRVLGTKDQSRNGRWTFKDVDESLRHRQIQDPGRFY